MNTTQIEKCTFLEIIHLKDETTTIVITVILTSIINSLTAFTAIIGNSVFLIVYTKVPAIRTPSNTLLASLSVTDLLVGLIVQPSSVVRRILEVNDVHNCILRVIFAFCGFLSCGASFLNVGLIALDRCLAICCPFWYVVSATKKTHSVIICIIWLIWGAFTLLPFAGVLSVQVYFIGVFGVLIVNVLVFLVSYAFIFRVIIAKKRRDAPRRVSSNFSHNPAYESNELNKTPEMCRKSENHLCVTNREDEENRTQRSKESREEKRNSYTIVFLVLCMLVCYAPQLTVLLMRGAFGDNENLVFIADAWVDTFTFLNSSVNPLIYCYRLTDIRDAVVRVFRRKTEPGVVTPNSQRRQEMSNSAVL